MRRFAVFAGQFGGNRRFLEAHGYLTRMVDEGILNDPIKQTDVWNDRDLEVYFSDDPKIGEVLDSMDLPQRYVVFRAEVVNMESFGEAAGQFQERFRSIGREISYKTYEANIPSVEALVQELD